VLIKVFFYLCFFLNQGVSVDTQETYFDTQECRASGRSRQLFHT